MPLANATTSLLTRDNFNLAWKRVVRSPHWEVKDRLAFRVFSMDVEHNLDCLMDEVREGVYRPSSAYKLYQPKRTRTLRAIPMLSVRDRVVYQAIGNVVSKEASPDVSAVADRYAFAPLPQGDESPFALKRWQNQYHRFTTACKRHWRGGNRWVVEADVSAFYASIDHDLLIDLLRERWVADQEVLGLLQRCLRRWSQHDGGPELGKGLPQGYDCSDVLATLFLLPLDEWFAGRAAYLRYVDDIRILCASRDQAARVLVTLDLQLQQRGLIIQTKKTAVSEVKSLSTETDRLRHKLSQLAAAPRKGTSEQADLREMFFDAWHHFEDTPEASESALVYSLNRLSPDEAIRNIAICLLDDLPWRSNVIARYLSQFDSDPVVTRALLRVLETHKVYSWHLANVLHAIAQIADYRVYRNVALEWIAQDTLMWPQRLAAVDVLRRRQDCRVALRQAVGTERNILVKRALVVACAFQARDQRQLGDVARIIRSCLEDDELEIRMLALWLLREIAEISWNDVGYGGPLGSLRPLVPDLCDEEGERACYVKHTLRHVYQVHIKEDLDLTSVFEDYKMTALDLRKAIAYYETDPSLYIGLIDSFNQRVAIALKSFVGSTIPNDQYANMLRSQEFRSEVPQVAVQFSECHDLRCRTTGLHAWSTADRTWSRSVEPRTKEQVHDGLKLAYQEFVDVICESTAQN